MDTRAVVQECSCVTKFKSKSDVSFAGQVLGFYPLLLSVHRPVISVGLVLGRHYVLYCYEMALLWCGQAGDCAFFRDTKTADAIPGEFSSDLGRRKKERSSKALPRSLSGSGKTLLY